MVALLSSWLHTSKACYLAGLWTYALMCYVFPVISLLKCCCISSEKEKSTHVLNNFSNFGNMLQFILNRFIIFLPGMFPSETDTSLFVLKVVIFFCWLLFIITKQDTKHKLIDNNNKHFFFKLAWRHVANFGIKIKKKKKSRFREAFWLKIQLSEYKMIVDFFYISDFFLENFSFPSSIKSDSFPPLFYL